MVAVNENVYLYYTSANMTLYKAVRTADGWQPPFTVQTATALAQDTLLSVTNVANQNYVYYKATNGNIVVVKNPISQIKALDQ